MRVTASLISFFLLNLLLNGCGSMQKALAELPESAPLVIVDRNADIHAISAPHQISYADIINDYLVLQVSYSGGCEDHDFEVLSTGKYTATYPPEITVHVKHYDNGDVCRGIIDEKRYFDVRTLQYPGTSRVRIIFAKSNKILDYIY